MLCLSPCYVQLEREPRSLKLLLMLLCSIVGHFSPQADDSTRLAAGDMVKM